MTPVRVLAGVTVEASSPARIGGAAVEVTNDQGLYRFENLPIGEYTLTFSLQGFTTIRHEGIRIEVGRTIELPAKMAIGDLNESLTVVAESPVVDTLHTPTRAASTARSSRTCRCSREDLVVRHGDLCSRGEGQPGHRQQRQLRDLRHQLQPELLPGERRGSLVAVREPCGTSPTRTTSKRWRYAGSSASAKSQAACQGGIVNIVTRAARTISAARAASSSSTTRWWRRTATRMRRGPIRSYIDYNQDYMFSLGGPIVKDKVSFYATLPGIRQPRLERRRRSAVRRRDAVCLPSLRQGDGAVVDAEDSLSTSRCQRQHLIFAECSDDYRRQLIAWTKIENGGQPGDHGELEAPDEQRDAVGGGGAAASTSATGSDPISGGFETPGHTDSGTGIATTNATTTTRWHMNDESVDGSLVKFISVSPARTT